MKYIILLILQLSFLIKVYAQKVAPQFSVDKYTGAGSINIPLGTVNAGELNLPVYLQYDATGVRIDDSGRPQSYVNIGGNKFRANVIGSSNSIKIATGWNLIAGGIIKRTVNALPDDFLETGDDQRKGWLHGTGAQSVNSFISASDNDLSNCDDEQSDYSILNAWNGKIDTEPDIFSFSFGEFAGNFVFDYHAPQGTTIRNIRTMPYQDLKITYTITNNSISEFQITTNAGIIYEFRPTVRINRTKYSDTFSSSINYTEEWGLYTVKHPFTTNKKITIQYNDIEYVQEEVTPIKIVTKDLNSETYHIDTIYTDHVLRSYRIPKAIIGRGSHAFFSTSEVRVTNLGSRMNPLVFTTSQVKGRTFLRSISEKFDCEKATQYIFEYLGVDFENKISVLPPTESYARDFWGYFNNTNDTTKLYPRIYIYPSLNGADRYRLHPIPGNSNYYLLDGANRNTDPDAVTAGLLTKIFTPFNGQSTVSYESNEYYDQTTGSTFKGGGVRVKKISIHDGIDPATDMVKEYEYDLNGGKLLYRPSFAYAVPTYWNASNQTFHYPSQYSGSDLHKLFTYRSETDLSPKDNDKSGVVYETITERQPGRGKTVYKYSIPATSLDTLTNDYASPYNYSATLSKVARLKSSGNCAAYGNGENGYFTFPFANNTNYDFERGLLLNKKDYNEDGHLVKELQYTYGRLNKAMDPYIVKGIKLESHLVNAIPFYQFGQYNLLTDVGPVLTTEKEIIIDQTDANKKLEIQKNYFYESNNHRLLTRTTSTNSAGVVNQARFKYAGDFVATANGTAATKALYGMNLKNMHAAPIEQTYSIIKPGEIEKVTSASLTKYSNISYFGIENYYPIEQYELRIAGSITNFNPALIGSSGGINDLIYDSRYKLTNKILTWNPGLGVALESMDDRKNIRSVIMNELTYLKDADISNARISEIAFGDFKDSSWDAATRGRNGWQEGLSLIFDQPLTKTNITKSTKSPTYTFSAWIEAVNGPGLLTVTLSDGINAVVGGFYYSGTDYWGWKFYKCTIPVSSLGNKFTATLDATSDIFLDHAALLYPSNASIKYYVYGAQVARKAADNDAIGNYFEYEYDDFGRLIHITDKNKDIIQRNTYPSYAPGKYVINADFHNVDPIAGTPSTFIPTDQCVPNTNYIWDYGDGSALSTNSTHTYALPGSYIVTLKTDHFHYGQNSLSKTVFVR